MATRSLFKHAGPDWAEEKLFPVLLPSMCLNRYYVAEGVRNYSQVSHGGLRVSHEVVLGPGGVLGECVSERGVARACMRVSVACVQGESWGSWIMC